MDRSELERFVEAHNKVRRMFMNAKAAGRPVSQIEYFALMLIWQNQQKGRCANTGLLSEHLAIGKSAVSQMLNSLEDKGMVERSVNRQDRRLFDLRVTEKGGEVLQAQKDKFLSVIITALDRMEEKDRSEFVRLMESFAEGFAGER